MNQLYLNHNYLTINSSHNVVQYLKEIAHFIPTLRSNNFSLCVREDFWNTSLTDSVTVLEFLHQYPEKDGALSFILGVMNSGPYFSSAPSSRPMIQPNFSSTFCEEIIFSCFEDSQEHIVSLQNENCLTSENYTVTHNLDSLDVKNYIGLSSLTNFFESQLTLRSINDVFKEIDKRTNKIKFLSEAIKSARLHNFHRKFSDVLSTILALETVDLALLKEGTNDIARMKAYQSSTGFKISGESEETLNRGRYEAQRTFVIPGMGKRLFEWHIKVGIDIRIHYYIDKENDIVYIGHCGKHLDI